MGGGERRMCGCEEDVMVEEGWEGTRDLGRVK